LEKEQLLEILAPMMRRRQKAEDFLKQTDLVL
jgi:hypothetical protein